MFQAAHCPGLSKTLPEVTLERTEQNFKFSISLKKFYSVIEQKEVRSSDTEQQPSSR